MNKKRSLQELTIKDNFMFGAVMLDPENCKGILERVLETSDPKESKSEEGRQEACLRIVKSLLEKICLWKRLELAQD